MKTKWIQKIDSVMGYGFKFLVFAVVFAFVCGFASSCFAVPAKALSVEDELKVNEYFEASQTRKGLIEYDYNADEDGNKSVHLAIMGLQDLALNAQSELYNDLSIGDTASISGSGGGALYRTETNGQIKIVNVSVASGFDEIVCTSPDWNVKLTVSNLEIDTFRDSWVTTDSSGYIFSYRCDFGDNSYSAQNYLYLTDLNGYLNTASSYGRFNTSMGIRINRTGIPVISSGTSVTTSNGLGGYGTSYTLPPDTFNTSEPWEYYNNTLLPYIRENYNIVDIDEYLYFPDGYNPGGDPAPIINNDNNVLILPPIIAGAGAIINVGGVDFNVSVPLDGLINVDGIQFQFPKNDNSKIVIDGSPYDLPLPEITIDGHTIEMPDTNQIIIDGVTFEINADGSLTIDGTNYPLPIGQPETMPPGASDYVMYYEIPTLERLNIVDATVTKPDLDAYANGMTVVWDSVSRILGASGYAAIIPVLLSFAAIYYLLFKVGGH